MNQLNPYVIPTFRIPFEFQIWNLLTNDPWYPKFQVEFLEHIARKYTDDEIYRQSRLTEIPVHKKEYKLLNDLCNTLQLKREIHVYQCDYIYNCKTIGCKHSNDASYFYITRPLNKVLLERELIPIFAHELGHLIFDIGPEPFNFLNEKYHQASSIVEQENILRLLYLANTLHAINEFNADRVALYLTGLESYLTSFSQLHRVNSRKKYMPDFESLFRTFPRQLKTTKDMLFINYQHSKLRMYTMFLFSHEHHLIESTSLMNLRPRLTLEQILSPDTIITNYQKLLNGHNSRSIINQMREEVEYILPEIVTTVVR